VRGDMRTDPWKCHCAAPPRCKTGIEAPVEKCVAEFVLTPGDNAVLPNERGRVLTYAVLFVERALRTCSERFQADGLRTCSERLDREKHCSDAFVVLSMTPGDTTALRRTTALPNTLLGSSRDVRGGTRTESDPVLHYELAGKMS
jgi:hypothetical protein